MRHQDYPLRWDLSLSLASFMESLSWVDQTHLRKHEGRNETRVMYHPNLVLYSSLKPEHQPRSLTTALPSFFVRQGRKAAVSLVVFG